MQRRLLQLMSAISLLLLLTGMVTPLMTLTRLWVFDEQMSIFSGVAALWEQQQFGLAALIAIFSIALPLAKLMLLFYLLETRKRGPGLARLLGWVHSYGRWAMLDVMVVAMLIVTVKLGVIVRIDVHYGLYLFAAGVLLTMFLTSMTVHYLERQLEGCV
jgi:paraquat-inducible protein A